MCTDEKQLYRYKHLYEALLRVLLVRTDDTCHVSTTVSLA